MLLRHVVTVTASVRPRSEGPAPPLQLEAPQPSSPQAQARSHLLSGCLLSASPGPSAYPAAAARAASDRIAVSHTLQASY
eukprot:1967777-Rhodomonas_salina.2